MNDINYLYEIKKKNIKTAVKGSHTIFFPNIVNKSLKE